MFLEGSTTVLELAGRLHNRNRLTVVTNSPTIVCQLQHSTGVTVLSPVAICRRTPSISRENGPNAPFPRYGWTKPSWA